MFISGIRYVKNVCQLPLVAFVGWGRSWGKGRAVYCISCDTVFNLTLFQMLTTLMAVQLYCCKSFFCNSTTKVCLKKFVKLRTVASTVDTLWRICTNCKIQSVPVIPDTSLWGGEKVVSLGLIPQSYFNSGNEPNYVLECNFNKSVWNRAYMSFCLWK